MRLCIPVSQDKGLESVIEPYLPNAEYFLFFDTETRLYDHFSLRAIKDQPDDRVLMDAVLCGSINRVTLLTLMTQGVKVYGTEALVVAQAIAEFENGELVAAVMGPEHEHGGGCCSGHGQGHGGTDTAGCGGAHQCGGESGKGGGCGGHGHESGGGGGGCCGDKARQGDTVVTKKSSDVLRIAVTSQNRKTVTEHAGKCRKFWVYEVINGQVNNKTLLELPIEQSLHESQPGQTHPLDTLNVLISGSMGSGLKERLLQRGIHGIVTQETDPDTAVASLLSGAMSSLPEDRPWAQGASVTI